jgi:hypothetical protein
VFLAFARLYPDFVLMIMFVLPVKIKWLALLQWIGYGIVLLFGSWMERAMVVCSVANYLLFFGSYILADMKHGHRRMRQQAKSVKSPGRIIHKCAICGLSSDVSPQTQFRYCSKCDGEQCYCPEHLLNHEHVVREKAESAGGTAR